jgi:hypothetical protein
MDWSDNGQGKTGCLAGAGYTIWHDLVLGEVFLPEFPHGTAKGTLLRLTIRDHSGRYRSLRISQVGAAIPPEIKSAIPNGVGEIALTANEYKAAQSLGDEYWLYVAFNCASGPEVTTIQNSARLEWEALSKIDCYRIGGEGLLQGTS